MFLKKVWKILSLPPNNTKLFLEENNCEHNNKAKKLSCNLLKIHTKLIFTKPKKSPFEMADVKRQNKIPNSHCSKPEDDFKLEAN